MYACCHAEGCDLYGQCSCSMFRLSDWFYPAPVPLGNFVWVELFFSLILIQGPFNKRDVRLHWSWSWQAPFVTDDFKFFEIWHLYYHCNPFSNFINAIPHKQRHNTCEDIHYQFHRAPLFYWCDRSRLRSGSAGGNAAMLSITLTDRVPGHSPGGFILFYYCCN